MRRAQLEPHRGERRIIRLGPDAGNEGGFDRRKAVATMLENLRL